MFDGLLCDDIIKIPLPFYNTLGMFYYGLPSAVDFIIVFDSNLVLINQICVLGAFYNSAFGIFSALCEEFAIYTE
ncbi:hypothetical protein [Flavobacterium sp. DSR3-2]|uniref:hypothetical protein n=1 Tax=Flavobacterium sp. DSR3-2 TaxID=2804634 RepID=UPI003CF21FD8